MTGLTLAHAACLIDEINKYNQFYFDAVMVICMGPFETACFPLPNWLNHGFD